MPCGKRKYKKKTVRISGKKRADFYVKQLRERGLKVTRTKVGKYTWDVRF